MAEFGRIDYLINNAGVAGAEDMVIDMPLDTWRWTLDANLISNYLLMHYVVPIMKRQGSGYILNVSSYFGGEKFLAVAYPNRADYAVSKAGQRAMVESFSRFLGPEIQVNAIAPGPVDGDRLSGTGGKPGLFLRRARLILENKRLNAIYAAVIESIREGAEVHACARAGWRATIPAISATTVRPPIRCGCCASSSRARATASAPGTAICSPPTSQGVCSRGCARRAICCRMPTGRSAAAPPMA